MRTPRIYTTEALCENARVRLQGQPGHYISRVLRRGLGDAITLFNGQGGEYTAQVTAVERNTVELAVGRFHPVDSDSPLHTDLGLVISKGDRMDWAIQKATELGLTKLTPLVSERCEVKLVGERAARKHAHWRQVAISACEQCGRNILPHIDNIFTIDEWVKNDAADLSLVFAADGVALQDLGAPPPGRVKLLIGPEGGLTETELNLASSAGFKLVALGPRILRTETAPIAALALAQFLWGDFQAGSTPINP